MNSCPRSTAIWSRFTTDSLDDITRWFWRVKDWRIDFDITTWEVGTPATTAHVVPSGTILIKNNWRNVHSTTDFQVNRVEDLVCATRTAFLVENAAVEDGVRFGPVTLEVFSAPVPDEDQNWFYDSDLGLFSMGLNLDIAVGGVGSGGFSTEIEGGDTSDIVATFDSFPFTMFVTGGTAATGTVTIQPNSYWTF